MSTTLYFDTSRGTAPAFYPNMCLYPQTPFLAQTLFLYPIMPSVFYSRHVPCCSIPLTSTGHNTVGTVLRLHKFYAPKLCNETANYCITLYCVANPAPVMAPSHLLHIPPPIFARELATSHRNTIIPSNSSILPPLPMPDAREICALIILLPHGVYFSMPFTVLSSESSPLPGFPS